MPDYQLHCILFTVTEVDGRCEVRPSSIWSQCGYLIFASGGVLLLYLAGRFLVHPGLHFTTVVFGVVLVGVAALLFWQSLRYWRLRQIPLVVESNGRVSYGERELCPADSVRFVRIHPDPQAEHGDCKVVIEVAEGPLVSLPQPYFGAISHREPARLLAAELARALRVEMVDVA